jgi:hypothetical protein
MICIKTKSHISCLMELKYSCKKVANEITFHPSFNTFYHPCMCYGVTKIVEHWLTS